MNSAFAHARAIGIKTVRLVVHQPKVHGTTEHVVTLEDLEAFASLARSKACSVENAARDYGHVDPVTWNEVYLNPTPNEVECAFCRAMSTCPNAIKSVAKSIGLPNPDDFSPVIDNPIDAADVVAEALDLADTHADQRIEYLGSLMKATDFVEDWCKAVRAETERVLLATGNKPEVIAAMGFGLELGRQGPRKFGDPEAAETMLTKTFRLKVEEAYDFSLKSPTQLEKHTKATKAEDGAEIKPVIGPKQWRKVEALIVRSDPKPSVKPADKIKNPYVPPAPSADDFSPVVPEEEDIF